jgi:20S proteasome alpha/beta subunit
VIGEGEVEIEQILHKQYKESITVEEGLKLALKSLKKVLDKDFSAERVDAAYIMADEKKFKKFSKNKIEKLLNAAKK